MLGQNRTPENEEEFSRDMSQEERDQVATFITVVAEFLENRFPTQKNPTTRQRQRVQAMPGNNNTNNLLIIHLN